MQFDFFYFRNPEVGHSSLLFSIVGLFTLWLVSDVKLLNAKVGWLILVYPLPWQPTPELYTVACKGM